MLISISFCCYDRGRISHSLNYFQVEAKISEAEAVCWQRLLDTRPWARDLGVGVELEKLTTLLNSETGEQFNPV